MELEFARFDRTSSRWMVVRTLEMRSLRGRKDAGMVLFCRESMMSLNEIRRVGRMRGRSVSQEASC